MASITARATWPSQAHGPATSPSPCSRKGWPARCWPCSEPSLGLWTSCSAPPTRGPRISPPRSMQLWLRAAESQAELASLCSPGEGQLAGAAGPGGWAASPGRVPAPRCGSAHTTVHSPSLGLTLWGAWGRGSGANRPTHSAKPGTGPPVWVSVSGSQSGSRPQRRQPGHSAAGCFSGGAVSEAPAALPCMRTLTEPLSTSSQQGVSPGPRSQLPQSGGGNDDLRPPWRTARARGRPPRGPRRPRRLAQAEAVVPVSEASPRGPRPVRGLSASGPAMKPRVG